MSVRTERPVVQGYRGPVDDRTRSGVELSVESRAWVSKLRAVEPERGRASAAPHERSRREAGSEIRRRVIPATHATHR